MGLDSELEVRLEIDCTGNPVTDELERVVFWSRVLSVAAATRTPSAQSEMMPELGLFEGWATDTA